MKKNNIKEIKKEAFKEGYNQGIYDLFMFHIDKYGKKKTAEFLQYYLDKIFNCKK